MTNTASKKALGKKQTLALSALRRHGKWHVGYVWTMGNANQTARVLDSLVARGLARREEMVINVQSIGPRPGTVRLLPVTRTVYTPVTVEE